MNDALERYRSLTRVQIYNDTSTSFWFDDWLGAGPLTQQFLALFSHYTQPYASVASTLRPYFSLPLRPRLSGAAMHEQTELSNHISMVTLDDADDMRVFI